MERIARSRRTAVLAVGDAAMIALFVAAGEFRHGGTLAAGVETFLQFAVGWAVVAVLAGAYADDALASTRRAGAVAAVAWVVGSLVGQGVRIATEASAGFAPAFVAVTVAVGGVLLAGWRMAAVALLD